MVKKCRQEVIMPGGTELTPEAEPHLEVRVDTKLLSVAWGTGELELYLAEKYGCTIIGVDIEDWPVSSAREKAAARGLENLVTFEIGDGDSLKFATGTIDLVFCSGALCVFFDNGLNEFHRVLRSGSKAVIIDVIWRNERVPQRIEQIWAGGTAVILGLDGNRRWFRKRALSALFKSIPRAIVVGGLL